MARPLATLALALLMGSAYAHRTLVVCDAAVQKSHSKFFDSLKGACDCFAVNAIAHPFGLLLHRLRGLCVISMLTHNRASFIIARDHVLTFKQPGDKGLSTRYMGERVYDNLVLLAPRAKGMPIVTVRTEGV